MFVRLLHALQCQDAGLFEPAMEAVVGALSSRVASSRSTGGDHHYN
jgi:hypothetical protein